MTKDVKIKKNYYNNNIIYLFIFFFVVLAQYIQKSDIFQNNLGKMSTVFFMLCPLSAKGHRDIADIDPNVQNMGRVEIELNGRKYTPTIYKVTGKNEKGKDEVREIN